MDWAVRQTQRPDGVSGTLFDGVLHGFGKTRRCNVDGLLEIGAFERVGLIENCQHTQITISEKAFDGNLPARNVTFHKHLIEIRLTSGKNLGRLEQVPDARGGSEKLLAIVCAHNALAR